MENVYEIIETSSDETDNSSEEELEENKDFRELNSEFLNYTKVDEYLKNRNSLFTRDIEQLDLVVSKNYEDFDNSENYEGNQINNFTFDFKTIKEYKNIIGFELLDTIVHINHSQKEVINIIIDDIPLVACIQNNENKHLITKLSINATGENIFQNEIGRSMLNRYFFPITLNKLDVRFEKIDGDDVHLNLKHISLMFRLTIVNNLNLLK